MWRNYLRMALRQWRRNKVFTAIHLAGLSIGMAGCILIFLFIEEEFRYVNYHAKGDRVFRVLRQSEMAGSGAQIDYFAPSALGPAMQREFPQVEDTARLLDDWWIWTRHGDKELYIDVALGDAALLEMFDIPLLRGDRATVLARPNTAVITQRLAGDYFGDQDPIGQVITVADDKLGGDYVVTGLMGDMSPYAQVAFDFLTAHPSAETSQWFRDQFDLWETDSSWRPFVSYIMLREGASAAQVEAHLADFEVRHLGAELAAKVDYRLQPVDRIRLYSEADYGLSVGRGIEFVRRLALIGALLLLIACVNFMNLATAQSSRRAKEVGLRKVIGAGRRQLARQFLGEAVLLTGAALVLAYAMARLGLPFFNEFMQVNQAAPMTLEFGHSPGLGMLLVGLGLGVGVLAGSYPAFVLARFQPVQTLKGRLASKTGAPRLRQGLVVLQFAVSAVLLIAAAVVYQQGRHMNEKDLGYDKQLLVNLPLYGRVEVGTDAETVKRAFLDHPQVLGGTASWPPPGSFNYVEYHAVRPQGEPEGAWEMQVIGIDGDFLETFGMELVAGRNLKSDRQGDSDAFLLNETAVRQLGWEDPIGKSFDWQGEKSGHVVGVVRDFHTESLYRPIEPLVMHHWAQLTLTLRLSGRDMPGTLEHLEATWQRFVPDVPFEHWFLDRELARYYQGEAHLNKIFALFALLAVLVACLGLFGLASYAAEQRTKEIGVRKVLGATAAGIAALFSRDFVKLIALANLLAAPVAYYLMSQWLAHFPYRIDLSSGPFLWCGGATLVLAAATVGYQALKSAQANPVESLRYE
ncbi:MAG: FtsX-like permease family protein [Candidatus Latescibacteria bacterium]|nr:FtsX-like permease family protein [Candidatus Latescibacterota bacterium]